MFYPDRLGYGKWKTVMSYNKEFNITKEEYEMAKNSMKVLEKTDDVQETFTPNKAFSIVYNGNKRYSVVSVDFNPVTNTTGNVTVIEDNLDLYECQHVFKTSTVKAGLFDEGLDKTE